MRKLFVVSYSGPNGAHVKEGIKELGSWANWFENQYMVHTEKNAAEIKSLLSGRIIVGTDKLLILEISVKTSSGWLTKSGWEWINDKKEKQ